MKNEEYAYHGIITFLEIPLKGSEYEQDIKNYANFLLQFGMSYEKYGKFTKDGLGIGTFIEIIDESPSHFYLIADTALNVIENYIKKYKHKGYDIEANKVCFGTLKLLKYMYYFTKDASCTHSERVNKLFHEMEKVCEETYDEVWTDADLANPYNERHGSRRSKNIKSFDDKQQLKQDRKYDDGFGKANRSKAIKIRKELDKLDDQDIEDALIEEF